jgi:hypothetical protein
VRVAKALKVSGMHTISAAWWQQPVGQRVLLSVDVRAVDNARPWIWLSGPGYGTAPSLGYRIQMILGTPRLDLLVTRQGRPLGPMPDGPPLQWGEWYRLEVLRDGGDIAVSLNGRRLGRWHDPRPLVGPMHRFAALGSHLGLAGKGGAWYRNLALRMPPGEAERLAEHPPPRILDPPVTLPPLPDGKRLAEDEFAAGGLDGWSGTKPAWGVHVRKEGLVLSGPNCWPRPWRNEPVTGNFALDVPMRYFPNGEAVNFEVRLRFGEFVDAKKDRYTGWGVTVPAGDGVVAIHWHDEQGHSRRLATSGYFAPAPGRRYLLRLERVGDRLRLFANGGYLAEAGAPVQVPLDQPVYIGFRQIYGGSVVERLVVSRIGDAAPPGLIRRVPGETLDTGPTLAATAHFQHALRRQVHPALAERAYVDAQVALTRLSICPEFGLAGAAIALAERDLDRLLRFWAAARPRVEQNPNQDVLGLLGEDFLNRDPAEHRLQAALFLLYDKDGDPKRAARVLEPLSTLPDACRVRALAARRLAHDAGAE